MWTASVDYRSWKAEREAGYAALITEHFDQAEERFRNALAIASRRSLFDPYVAAGHVDLAEVSRARGDLEDAERHLKRAITLLERRLGSSHLDVLKVSQSLADLYVEQKRYAQAEVLLTRLLQHGRARSGRGASRPATHVAVTDTGPRGPAAFARCPVVVDAVGRPPGQHRRRAPPPIRPRPSVIMPTS